MRKLLLLVLIIAFVGTADIQPPKIELNEQQKKAIQKVQVALTELSEKLANAQGLDEILAWLKQVGCSSGAELCEVIFPGWGWLCSVALSFIC